MNYPCMCLILLCCVSIPSLIAYSVACRNTAHTLLAILVNVNLSPWRFEHIRYRAISSLSPWRCCLLSSNDSAMKTQEAARRAMGLQSMPLRPTISEVMSQRLPSSLLSPLWQAVKTPCTANVSECSVIQGCLAAVDKYWKCYPSLKHHSFTYCKCTSLWAQSPHCWQGRKTTPGGPRPWPSIFRCNHRHSFHD